MHNERVYFTPQVISGVMGTPLRESIGVEPRVVAVILARLVDIDCQINALGDGALIGSFLGTK